MPDETVKLGSGIAEGAPKYAKICGESFYFHGIIFYHGLTANVIAVDGMLVPAFMKKEQGIWNETVEEKLESYCVEVTEGEHKLLLLAEWEFAIGWGVTLNYHAAECTASFVSGKNYLVTTKTETFGKDEIVIAHIIEDVSEEPVATCETSIVPRYTEFIENLRSLQ